MSDLTPMNEVQVDDGDARLEFIAKDIELLQATAVLRVAERLAEAREIFRYRRDEGGFTGWVERRLRFSQRTAYNLLSVHERFGDESLQILQTLPRSVLYLLAAPSTTDETCKEVAELIEAGEYLKPAQVKKIIEDAADATREGWRVEIETQVGELRAQALQREAELRAEYEGAGQAKIDKAVTKATASLQKKIEKYENKLAKIAEREAARAERDAKPPKPSKKNGGGGTNPPRMEPSAEFLRKFTFGNCLEAIFKQIEGLAVEQVVEVGQLGDLPRQAAVVAEWLERFVTVASGGAPAMTETKIDPSKLN